VKGSTHLAGGLLAGALIGTNPVGLAVSGLASLAPDWIQINIPGANQVVKGATGHRGLSHWGITAGLVWMIVSLAGQDHLAAFATAGWLSHILLDTVSGGTPAFWPVARRVTLARIKTGSTLDTLTGAGLLVLCVLVIVAKLGGF